MCMSELYRFDIICQGIAYIMSCKSRQLAAASSRFTSPSKRPTCDPGSTRPRATARLAYAPRPPGRAQRHQSLRARDRAAVRLPCHRSRTRICNGSRYFWSIRSRPAAGCRTTGQVFSRRGDPLTGCCRRPISTGDAEQPCSYGGSAPATCAATQWRCYANAVDTRNALSGARSVVGSHALI